MIIIVTVVINYESIRQDRGAAEKAFGDVWHTSGEDGYRSALFHASVRCRQSEKGLKVC